MPKKIRPGISLVLFAAALAHAQAFDAASVKPADPNLPGGRIVVGMQPPTEKLTAPDWLDTHFFRIDATMPPFTTREQFRTMLQNLLAERFQLKVRREAKDAAIYSHQVAKVGPKMKESAQKEDVPLPPGAFNQNRPAGRPELGPDGFPWRPNVPATGAGIFSTIGTLGVRLTARRRTMHHLANTLNAFAARPVVDDTGLTAKYDFVLTFLRPGAAIQSQLGLKRESQKGTADTPVIDPIEKTPIEN